MASTKMNCRRTSYMCLFVFVIFVIIVYMTFFNHGPPEKILSANSRTNAYLDRVLAGDGDEEVLRSARAWDSFMKANHYVSIGDIYDSCEEDGRKWLGKTIILPDKRRGGVTSKTFLNVTFEKTLDDGEFFLSVSYGGKDLYENKWKFCEMEEDEDDEERWIFCPYKPGSYSWVIDRKIPNYLPKGTYKATARLTDENEEVLMCGFAEFVL
ncbi:putative phosphatidylglycerol/phosphatidylinositol transfer protein DDB_G0282107 [Saccostrea cucullata]|uniref:putative phosphatidylglycerol/phosphatidylinositol transfer protein DDB_G0282107 n=1 Tax=Saccostrea cuccullata TaxID=36930 RepID=UPI002ED026DE